MIYFFVNNVLTKRKSILKLEYKNKKSVIYMLNTIKTQVESALLELIELIKLKEQQILVVGCSSSEIAGGIIGKNSAPELANEVASTILKITKEKGILLAAQCCEHLNRALIVEKSTAEKLGLEIVNVRPMVKAGGSFATSIYDNMTEPVAVEYIKADAGLDIGSTLIGMHLKNVAVPVRLKTKKIGEAYVTAARTRAKYIGGERAHYID